MITFDTSYRSIVSHEGDCLIVFQPPLSEGEALAADSATVDTALNGIISAMVKQGDFSGKDDEAVWLSTPHFQHKRVLLVGLGEADWPDAIDRAFSCLKARQVETVTVAAQALQPALVTYAFISATRACHQFCLDNTAGKEKSAYQFTLLVGESFTAQHAQHARASAEGVALCLHLAEQPGNVCTPEYLAHVAEDMAKEADSLNVTVHTEDAINAMGMHAFLGVAQGSSQSPRLIVFEYQGSDNDTPPIALVGKGITFDSGGISLKPAPDMDTMKFDMSGAATVFGVVHACVSAQLPINIVGIVPTCENLPGPEALKPGDILTAMSGKTIEVLNTDAEGRLILADALAYADTFNPSEVIDIATLTGACIVALGRHRSGLMGNNAQLLADLKQAGDDAYDPCWPLPIDDSYARQLKSDFADLANIGGKEAGTITAACFLSTFTQCARWAHLDIAGSAITKKKRGTARPVPLLMQYVLTRCQQ